MADRPFKRIIRLATAEERTRHAAIRQSIMQEFPPAEGTERQESPPGIPTQVRQAREAQGLTWYALAKLAGIPNANTVRDVEYGRDAPLSTLQAVAKALGLRLELVEEITLAR
jgi:DNA-binding transcriptional regulator YiaG